MNVKRGVLSEVYQEPEVKLFEQWSDIDELQLKEEDGTLITYFGIFWLDEDNDVIHQKFLKSKYKDRAFAFYSEVTSDRNANQAKLLVR